MKCTCFLHQISSDFLLTAFFKLQYATQLLARRADVVKRITNENILICFKRRLSCALVRIMAHTTLTHTAEISVRVGLCEERGFNPQANDGRRDVKKD
jgi:hypothetical protein